MEHEREDAASRPAQGTFRIVNAATAGPVPQEIARILERLSDAVKRALGDKASGMVAIRYGHRVVVAPVQNPHGAIDVADIDVPRRLILSVGGLDPTPQGALLAQVLFLRMDAVVGYADVAEVDGPTLEVLESILPSLRGEGSLRNETATVVIAMRPDDIADKLAALEAS